METRAAINLSRMRWDGVVEPGVYCINRVNTPKISLTGREQRGQGIASRLMRKVIHDADCTHSFLWLWISPSDGLNYQQLRDWYTRLGFSPVKLLADDLLGTIYVRWPCEALRPAATRITRQAAIRSLPECRARRSSAGELRTRHHFPARR